MILLEFFVLIQIYRVIFINFIDLLVSWYEKITTLAPIHRSFQHINKRYDFFWIFKEMAGPSPKKARPSPKKARPSQKKARPSLHSNLHPALDGDFFSIRAADG